MADGDYEYDVFISYRRSGSGQAGPWVHNHFHPLLRAYLADQLCDEPRVFLDEGIGVGEYWPDKLAAALGRSKLLVAVWSPAYFRSTWCLAEWQSMRRREHHCGLATSGRTQGLVCPVIFSDSQSFPTEAQVTQARNLKPWNRPDRYFERTEKYGGLREQVEALAIEVAALLPTVPAWDPSWPLVRPEPYAWPRPTAPTLEGRA